MNTRTKKIIRAIAGTLPAVGIYRSYRGTANRDYLGQRKPKFKKFARIRRNDRQVTKALNGGVPVKESPVTQLGSASRKSMLTGAFTPVTFSIANLSGNIKEAKAIFDIQTAVSGVVGSTTYTPEGTKTVPLAAKLKLHIEGSNLTTSYTSVPELHLFIVRKASAASFNDPTESSSMNIKTVLDSFIDGGAWASEYLSTIALTPVPTSATAYNFTGETELNLLKYYKKCTREYERVTYLELGTNPTEVHLIGILCGRDDGTNFVVTGTIDSTWRNIDRKI